MKNLFLIALVSLFVNTSCVQNNQKHGESSTYYLIRHAEKDRTDPSNHNPNLTDVGLKRAENWAKYFKDIKFDAVYSSDYNRTKQTALPTANANNLEIQIYNPSNLQVETFINNTKGQTVLIVGHSNTTPKFTNELLGEKKYEDMADNFNGGLYIVTITKDGKTAKKLVVN
ncbi:SixA phosphatase family protein [Winogradskyella sediminis]|uniref:Histidine phosphatase superfamily (Branch 1) n=1 Tax=Winogradskyella sediminis TaxID=1382466 RepID=A0A1H1WBC1_9FLAO|nr:phosphoglycerate mutase family protein [Winogradskyella sediminis]REG87971.1 histidine phosphatase superfamily protein (branch 1) [Winogradskyella sediminis]SDS94375.1 Histidine phosphatase superfamily (branch 1) [Winogradskyella sediminis]